MSLSETMTGLMNSARKYFEVDNKLSIANLINLFNPNPNLIKDTENWGDSNFNNINGSSVALTTDTYKGLKIIHCTNAWNSPSLKFDIQMGKTYTFSTYAKSDIKQQCGIYIVYTGHPQITNPNYKDRGIFVSDKWQRYSFTFTAMKSGTIYVRMEQGNNDNLYLAGYKLEEGSLATPLTELGGVTKLPLFAFLRGGACYAA